ncbi:Glycosyl-transferase family 4 [Pseudobutyrivibrio sp. ACV-2]|uniref:glycosyltransferase family 4 protein n=1 Tax=Pseudobutyrivibrio sp. ACV-2 TaxID=1520801 RepID=UPI00089B9A08|nr:glycosyltransferase family 4 protein [Pseudobutyrivibrio sp. ACV-2]SEA29911.1 Glycosyl-transferase family 4 [Pseudobutyrivibrio sp. ACV-2]
MISKKILLVSFEMTYSGAPVAVLKMARVFRSIGYQVDIWTLHDGPFTTEFSNDGFDIVSINYPSDAGYELDNKLKDYRLCICHTIFCSEIARYIQRVLKTVLYIHEADNIEELIKNCDIMPDDFLNINRYWCVSEYAKQKILDKYQLENLDILPNYVEEYILKENNVDFEKKLKLCLAGTIEFRKGLDVVVSAIDNLPVEVKKSIELHIIGRIPEWSQDYASKYINHECVVYHGEIRDITKLYRLYSSMDLFIIASRDESCSLVALEAAMLKKALLVTENTGAKYIVDNPKCILKTGDTHELANQITEFIKNRSLLNYEGKKNYRNYKKKASISNYKKKLIHNIFKIKFSLKGGNIK